MMSALQTESSGAESARCDAWLVLAGNERNEGATELVRGYVPIERPRPGEVLAAPLYGCWEGNMGHALARQPVDVARLRREPQIVIGNAGVVRVLEVGEGVDSLAPGDAAMTFPAGELDEAGYMMKARGFDAAHQRGLLARRVTMRADQLLRIRPDSRFSLAQWAAFSVRYVTAWSNWELALGVYRLQMSERDRPRLHIWGWGGGTTLAELDLARRQGCETVMISGSDENLGLIKRTGVGALDRRAFPGLFWDAARAAADAEYRVAHGKARRAFLAEVAARTQGRGVDVFLDYIGEPVYLLTLRALARQGVIATAGWKSVTDVQHSRAQECILRHQHVYTHFARRSQAVAAMEFAEASGWGPEVAETIYAFDELPLLAERYARNETHYFTCYTVDVE
jgi:NADPH:quinone reductase-like Zn-dependent oxidoreductase